IVAKTTNWDATFVRMVEKMLARILLTTNLADMDKYSMDA
ncbi:unnamed protein product, partial [Rotaria magnacalcarata]